MTRTAEYDSDIAEMYGTAKPSLVFSFNEDQSVGIVVGVGKPYYPTNALIDDPVIEPPVEEVPLVTGMAVYPLSFKPLGF